MNVTAENVVYTFWGNPECGYEFAYLAAKTSNKRVVVVDADLLNPSADLYAKVKKSSNQIIEDGSGLSILMNSIDQKYITGDIIERASVFRPELKNLFIITGNYDLENFVYYRRESYEEIIDKCAQCFDITVLIANEYPHDSYTVISLMKSDYVIIPISASTPIFRKYNNYISYLKERLEVDPQKFKFIAFEYSAKLHLSETYIRDVTGGRFLGSIGFDKLRVICRSKKYAYFKRMSRANKREYLYILNSLDISPLPRLSDRIKDGFAALLVQFKSEFRHLKKGRGAQNAGR